MYTCCLHCFQGGMGGQGMMFGNQQTTTTQVSIPKDVRFNRDPTIFFIVLIISNMKHTSIIL